MKITRRGILGLALAGLFSTIGLPARQAPAQTVAPAVRSVRVTITSAQLLALNATPRTVVAAPGSGLCNIFEGAILYHGTQTAYAGIATGEDLSFKYTDGSGQELGVCETTGFLDQTSAQIRYTRAQTGAISAGTVSSFTPAANAAIVLQLLTGEITTGNGDLKLRVFYRTVATTL